MSNHLLIYPSQRPECPSLSPHFLLIPVIIAIYYVCVITHGLGEKVLVDYSSRWNVLISKISGKLYKSCMCLILSQSRRCLYIQYCAKVMQAKCANFVLCSRDFSMKVRLKVRMKFHGISSDNSLQQRAIFLRSFVPLKKMRALKR